MDKTKNSIRPAIDFNESERRAIIEEYLSSNLSKVEIWRKYTGYQEEHGSLLKWMRKLDYSDKPKNSEYSGQSRPPIPV